MDIPITEFSLKKTVSIVAILEEINDKAQKGMNSDPEKGIELILYGLRVAETCEDSPETYRSAEAECQLTLGRLHLKSANYGSALNAFAQALSLFELDGQAEKVALSRSFVGISYGYMGEFDKALENLFEALNEARECNNQPRTAEIINDIGYCYVLLGQPDMAIPLLDECIPILREINDPLSLSWALDTQASAFIRSGDLTKGLEIELEAIGLAQSVESWEDLTDYYAKIGEVYKEMGDWQAAEQALNQAQEVVKANKLRNGLSRVLVEIGSLYLQQGQTERAIETTAQAVHIAVESNSKTDLMDGYFTLSAAYEKLGDLVKALDYFKKYNSVSQELFNEKADRRLKNLQVMFQLDTIRHEAETFQRQNQALKDEIERQKRSQTELEYLARTDPLTNTLNRRAFLEQGNQLFQQAQEGRSQFTVIMLDLDHFKEVNDRYGHIVGDQVLSAVVERIRQNMRAGDCLARYGGEEFILLMPNLSRQMAFNAAERIRKGVERAPFLVQHDIFSITISLGVACTSKETRPKVFRDLVQQADQALYDSKNKGRNCTSVYRTPRHTLSPVLVADK